MNREIFHSQRPIQLSMTPMPHRCPFAGAVIATSLKNIGCERTAFGTTNDLSYHTNDPIKKVCGDSDQFTDSRQPYGRMAIEFLDPLGRGGKPREFPVVFAG